MMLPPLFNPSNDLALAANTANYIPPRHVVQMESDLQSITRFWHSGPWGWSLNARSRYLKMGIPEHLLPTDAWLQRHRQLSSRATACQYLHQLLQAHDWGHRLVGHSAALMSTVPDTCSTELIFKSLWSSSGKGNIPTIQGQLVPSDLGRVQRFIREHGAVVVEQFYADKQVDFAMEFFIHPHGEAEFLGYSVFLTAERGRYGGQIIDSQAAQLAMIDADRGLLRDLLNYHLTHLPQLGYTGPLGIDMMRLSDGRLHPVVEINMRRNMGILALELYQRGLTHDQALTPPAPNGFQMAIQGGLLQILR